MPACNSKHPLRRSGRLLLPPRLQVAFCNSKYSLPSPRASSSCNSVRTPQDVEVTATRLPFLGSRQPVDVIRWLTVEEAHLVSPLVHQPVAIVVSDTRDLACTEFYATHSRQCLSSPETSTAVHLPLVLCRRGGSDWRGRRRRWRRQRRKRRRRRRWRRRRPWRARQRGRGRARDRGWRGWRSSALGEGRGQRWRRRPARLRH